MCLRIGQRLCADGHNGSSFIKQYFAQYFKRESKSYFKFCFCTQLGAINHKYARGGEENTIWSN